MTPSFFAEKFDRALPYDAYVRTGTVEQQRRWQQVYDVAALTVPQRALVGVGSFCPLSPVLGGEG